MSQLFEVTAYREVTRHRDGAHRRVTVPSFYVRADSEDRAHDLAMSVLGNADAMIDADAWEVLYDIVAVRGECEADSAEFISGEWVCRVCEQVHA